MKGIVNAATVFCVIGLLSCTSSKELSHKENNEVTRAVNDTTLVLEFHRSGCFGTCPADKIWVQANGTAKYYGIAHVPKRGHFKGLVEQTLMDSIFNYAKQVRFFEMDSVYAPKFEIADIPSYTLFLQSGAESNKVLDKSYGPAEMKVMYQMLHRLILKTNWEETKLDSK